MLTCTFQDKKFVKTKENMLIFLDEFITLLGKRVQDYALDIKVKLLSCNAFELSAAPVASPLSCPRCPCCLSQQTCLNVFRREQSNTVKQVTFSPIIKLIKLKLHILDADKLDVKDMCEMYISHSHLSVAFAFALLTSPFCFFCPPGSSVSTSAAKHRRQVRHHALNLAVREHNRASCVNSESEHAAAAGLSVRVVPRRHVPTILAAPANLPG